MEVWFGRLLLGQVDLGTKKTANETEKNVTNDQQSVTYVLTQECYRCTDCAISTPLTSGL